MTQRLHQGPLSLGLLLALSLSACSAPPSGARQVLLAWGVGDEARLGSLELQLEGLPYRLSSLASLASLRVSLKPTGLAALNRQVDAAALQAGQGRVSFQGIPLGPVLVEVSALNAQGQLLGYAKADSLVVAGQSTRVALRLAVGATPPSVPVGVDLVVSDDPASGLVRPLSLVRVAPLPANAQGFNQDAYTQDLQYDTQDGSLWASLRHGSSNRLAHFQPDLQASSTVLGAGAYLAPWPRGGVLSVEANRQSTLVDLSHQLRQYAPVPLADNDSVAALGRNRDGLWAAVGANQNQLRGPAIPHHLGLSPAWALGTGTYTLPKALRDQGNGNNSSAQYMDIAPSQDADALVIHDESRAWEVNARGSGRTLFTAESNTTGPLFPNQANNPNPNAGAQGNGNKDKASPELVAEADALAATGVVPGMLTMVAPDHRGGLWVCSSVRFGRNDYLMIWRRSPGGGITRVWGPFLSAPELALVQAAGRSPNPPRVNLLNPNASVEATYGVLGSSVGDEEPMLAASLPLCTGDTRPGSLAFSNSSGLFVWQEGAASAP